MTRRPGFWIVFALLSAAATAAAYRAFPRAFPIVSLDLRMNREQALAAAADLATRYHIAPGQSRHAASFGLDDETQTFIELEGGGKEAFAAVLRENLYAPFAWRVRRFREGETREATLRFRPDGSTYGFTERLREDEAGAAISSGAARRIAEDGSRSWGVTLDRFRLAEQSQERRPAGRVDHTLVYERPDRMLGAGRYRLRLVVSGERLTDVTYFIKVPEAFSRRYEEMRAANQAIGAGSAIAVLLLYGIGGIVIGCFVLLRQRALVWRAAVAWAVAIGALQGLEIVNGWPLAWMEYDTAISARQFALRVVSEAAAGTLFTALLLALSFIAAEGLTRRAFPRHPQLWHLWSRQAAASPQILGRTLAGYLLVGLFFAYEVALYFVATRRLGWWTPSEALIHPDVLATYAPWLSAVAPSLQAGFWEECLFRAVPLAGAALIGDRVGRRNAFVAVAFVLQAVIFGAGHAPYPTQPSYARLVELMVPSFLFGAVYLRYGLLPAIVLHVLYDLVWFSLPLFVSDAGGIADDRTIVILLAAVPLMVVLVQRWRLGHWRELPGALRNGAWAAPAVAPHAAMPLRAPVSAGDLTPRVLRAVLASGVVGAAAWLALAAFRGSGPTLDVGRTRAAAIARDALERRGVRLPSSWRTLPLAFDHREDAHEFVWKKAGRETYEALAGTFLPQPGWVVRAATFEGPVDERAEEWAVHLDPRGVVHRVEHRLPEARAGRTLSEAEARPLALAALRDRLRADGRSMKEISSVPAKLAARTDWIFTFADTSAPKLPAGSEARVLVEIAGDEVVDVHRFVKVPEEWEREQRREAVARTVATTAAGVSFGLLVLGCAGAAVVAWSRRRFDVRVFVAVFAMMTALSWAGMANGWPRTLASLSTSQPLNLQITMAGLLPAIIAALLAAIVALIAGWAIRDVPRRPDVATRTAIGAGLAFGAIAMGLRAALAALQPGRMPPAADYSGVVSYLPLLAEAFGSAATVLGRTVFMLMVVAIVHAVTAGWTRRRPAGAALLIMMAAAGDPAGGTVPWYLWAATAAATGALLIGAYVSVLRVDVRAVPVAIGTLQGLALIREGLLRPYPAAPAGALLGLVATAIVVWWWLRILSAPAALPPVIAAAAEAA